MKHSPAQRDQGFVTPAYDAAVDSLCTAIARWHRDGATVIGLSGAQGTGKSTLASHLLDALAARHGLRGCILSLDDLYLTHSARLGLSKRVHPLFITRGVPGTHDAMLGLGLIKTLLATDSESEVAIPRFVKAIDDRAPISDWHRVQGPIDIVLFEGWCLGVGPVDADEDGAPINALEASEDAEGLWRTYIERELLGPYADLFARLDRLVFLQVPDFEQVQQWRGQQEQENARQVDGAQPMSPEALQRFISHYERLTRRALATLPDRCDALIRIAHDHSFEQVDVRS